MSQPLPTPTPHGREHPPATGGLAERLAALGVRPNHVSVAGLLFAVAGGVALARGAGHTLPLDPLEAPRSFWPLLAAFLVGFSALADIADGALARRSGLATRFGALFDSTLDRFGDAALCLGCAVHFAALGNASFVLIAGVALVAHVQVSYVKARGENLVPGLGVGFWQRGERMVTLIFACLLGRVPVALCLLAVLPLLTVGRRMLAARTLLAGGAPEPTRAPRGSRQYLLQCISLIGVMWFAPFVSPFFQGLGDPIGHWLRAALP